MKPYSFIVSLLAALVLPQLLNAADLIWIGGTGGWNTAANWSPTQVPGSTDNAFITNSGTYTVTVPAGTTALVGSITIGGSSGTQLLSIDRATLTLNGASLVNPNGRLELAVSQSILNGVGSLTVLGTLNWANGTMSGSGVTTIGSSGVLAVGSGGVTLGRTLINGGSGSWAGGNFNLSAGSAFNNLSGATFDISADGRLSGSASTSLGNAGLFRQTGGSAGTLIAAPFNNDGTLQVMVSSLSLNLGGSDTGTFSVTGGASLNLGGGSHLLAAGSLVTGTGSLNVSGAATLLASGTFAAGSVLNVSSGVATLANSCDVTGSTLNVSGNGGIIIFNSAGPVAAVNLSAGLLGGTRPIFVSGLLTLSGGTVTNELVIANGGLVISGNTTLNGTKLTNPGNAIWSSGNFTGANGATISNLFGATFINTFDGNAASGAGATPIFVNAGLFQKTGGTAALGATSIDFQFINTGTVEVQTNTLRYGANQQTFGLTLLDGGDLAAQAQPIQLLGGSLVGTGLVTVANVQNLVNSASLSPGLPLGELDISGDYQQTVSGVLNIELGGYSQGINYDFVAVSAGGAGGVAALGGALNITFTNGFSPTNGATFAFLTAVSRTGAFTTFNYPSNDIGLTLSYDATTARVTVSNLKPIVASAISSPPAATYGTAFSYQFPADTFSDPDNNSLTYSASGMPAGVSFTGSTRTFSGTPTQAGVFPISVAATDNGIPNLSVTNTFLMAVDPAILSITVSNDTKPYGAALPTLTLSFSGFLNGDTASSLTTLPTITTPATASSAVGTYPIMAGGAVDPNYTILYSSGTLTVTPVPLTVTAKNQSKPYGSVVPVLTLAYDGFVNSDTEGSFATPPTITTAATASSAVGAYPIVVSGAVNSNYTISFVPGSLAVTPVGLTITANDQSKAYGAALPALTASYNGFVNGDTAGSLTTAPTITTTATASSAAGSYPILANAAASANYTISYAPGSLTVTPVALTITATDQTKAYGATLPALTASYAGFVNGDTASSLTTVPTITTTATASSAVGTYPLVASAAVDANYTISYAPGSLTVTPVGLTITANDQSKAYGAAVPALTASYNGFVNGDTAVSLTTAPTIITTATISSAVGTYPIVASAAADANYTISYAPGSLVVTPAGLTITANDQSKTYGAALPALTVSYTGFVNSDTAASLTTQPTVATSATASSAAGSYPITSSGAVSSNYAISYVSGNLTINRAPLAITANDQTKALGTPDPIFTVVYNGFVAGETASVLDGTLSLARAPGETPGSYLITPSGLSSSNYLVSFHTGTLTIIAPTAPISLALKISGPSGLLLSWPAISNLTYRVQFKSDLAANSWTELPPDVTATAELASKTDLRTATNRFYRVQVLP